MGDHVNGILSWCITRPLRPTQPPILPPRDSNRGSIVTLAMHYWLHYTSTYRLNGPSNAEEHVTYAAMKYGTLYLVVFTSQKQSLQMLLLISVRSPSRQYQHWT